MTNIIDIAKHSEKAYLEYSIAVLKDRAIPYLQDGQKPVHRRILFAMNELGLKTNSTPKKSARIIGDILGKYHPHGDSAVYEAMVKMSQSFYLRYPLVEGQGNFGSRDGDSAAAMRYTEAKLTPIAELLLDDLKYDCAPYRSNYDSTLFEPELLPSRLNFLLINGTFGIAVGLSTKIPSHNIDDVRNATIAYLNNNNIESEELAEIIKGPDLPTGGQIITPKKEIAEIYTKGSGKLTVRCRWHSEKQGRGQYRIVITELPPKKSVKKILEKIDSIENPPSLKNKKNKKPNDKSLTDRSYLQNLISNAEDDSNKEQLRLIIEPRSSKVKPEELMEKLYKILELEESISVNMTCIGNDMKVSNKNIKDIISEWCDFRFLTVTRRIEHLLEKTNKRLHILEGREIAHSNIDEIIKIIKEEDDPESILMTNFNLSEIQAKDILDIKLRQLAKLEIEKIIKEISSLNKDKSKYEGLLSSKTKMTNLIKKEINSDTDKFVDERRTLIEEAEAATISVDDKIISEKVSILVNKHGWLTLRKGHDFDVNNVLLRDNSPIVKNIECMSTDLLFLLNSEGRIYNIKPHQIPSGKNYIHTNSLIDNTSQTITIEKINDEEKILFFTNSGYGFLSKGKDLTTKNKSGKQFINPDNYKVMKPLYINENNLITCLSSDDRILTFSIKEIKQLKNGGKGVQLIKLPESETLSDLIIHNENIIKIKNKKFNTDESIFKRARRGIKIK